MNGHEEHAIFEVSNGQQARRLLGIVTGDPRAEEAPAFFVGRELIIQATSASNDVACRRLLSAAYFVLCDWRSHDEEQEAENLLWQGIQQGLSAAFPTEPLEKAHIRFLQLENPTKAGRCAEELAEWYQFREDGKANDWFAKAEKCFRDSDRKDRLQSLEAARRGERFPSSMLLRRQQNPESSTILGSSTGYELRERKHRIVRAQIASDARRELENLDSKFGSNPSSGTLGRLRRFWSD